MNEKDKLLSILDNLKSGFELCVYKFADDTVIIKDIKADQMYFGDVLFNGNKPFFINTVKKETNFLELKDIK